MLLDHTVTDPYIYDDENPIPLTKEYKRFLEKTHRNINLCNRCVSICPYRKFTENIQISITFCRRYRNAN